MRTAGGVRLIVAEIPTDWTDGFGPPDFRHACRSAAASQRKKKQIRKEKTKT
jgi:hypothetical protein